jgi:crossover junction endodeoxyribonuclease RuvC
MIILGIDPGTATTGYGVIETLVQTSKKQFQLIEYGCIVTPKEQEMPMRLYSIQKDMHKLLKQFKPDCVSIEQLFFGVNSRTAMTVGQARGVVLSTVASYRIPIFEYQGLHVKHTITGSGKADKKEIQKYVMRYLGKRKLAKPANGYIDDAADALAVAICHYIKVSEPKAGSALGENISKIIKVSGVSNKSKKSNKIKAKRPTIKAKT